MFWGTKTGSILYLFSCAMLEAALKRTKKLPKRSWAFETPQDAQWVRFRGGLGGYWVHLGPSWAPRRPQDVPKTRKKISQKSS